MQFLYTENTGPLPQAQLLKEIDVNGKINKKKVVVEQQPQICQPILIPCWYQ